MYLICSISQLCKQSSLSMWSAAGTTTRPGVHSILAQVISNLLIYNSFFMIRRPPLIHLTMPTSILIKMSAAQIITLVEKTLARNNLDVKYGSCLFGCKESKDSKDQVPGRSCDTLYCQLTSGHLESGILHHHFLPVLVKSLISLLTEYFMTVYN